MATKQTSLSTQEHCSRTHSQVFPICHRRLNCSGFVKVNTDGCPKEVMYSPTSVCDMVFVFDGQLVQNEPICNKLGRGAVPGWRTNPFGVGERSDNAVVFFVK